VVLIDPSNFPENLAPGPYSWDKGMGWVIGSLNQGVVAARLALTSDWYLRSIRATVDFLCCWPLVDPRRIALSGHSQPANAALTYACQDPRIRAVIWNYGGWPWVMPYDPMKLPPVQIFHGEDDDVYNVKYARQLAFELQTHMRPHEVNIYPHQKHMFNVFYDLRRENRFMRPVILEAFERLVCFLHRTLG
jgi:dienelactone hydrolase